MNPTRTLKLNPPTESNTAYRGGSGRLQMNHYSGLPMKTSPQISQLSFTRQSRSLCIPSSTFRIFPSPHSWDKNTDRITQIKITVEQKVM